MSGALRHHHLRHQLQGSSGSSDGLSSPSDCASSLEEGGIWTPWCTPDTQVKREAKREDEQTNKYQINEQQIRTFIHKKSPVLRRHLSLAQRGSGIHQTTSDSLRT